MRRLLGFVVVALAAVAFVLAAPEAEAPDDASQGEAPVPQCAVEDPILTMDAIEADRSRGRHGSPEQAMRAEVTSIYPKLTPEAFRQHRSGSHAEFIHERDGRPVATAAVEQVGRGWSLETFHGCNTVLADARRGGRS